MKNYKPRDYQVNEIFDEIEQIKDFNNKAEQLATKFADHIPLQRILKMNFCDTIISILPEGTPPFNREQADGPQPASLWSYLQVFPSIVRSGQSARLKPIQVERIFIEMLEAIDVAEADLVCLAKDKQVQTKWPSITVELVNKAFPSLISSTLNYATPAPVTAEETAEQMLDEAKAIKEKVKELNAKAKELTAEAKKLMAESKEEASV